jgi:Fe-S-cluster containining protein
MDYYDSKKREKLVAEHKKQYSVLLKKAPVQKTLKLTQQLHQEAFSKIDCLQCANCCKNYSPRFKMPDIKRIAKYLRMKETAFIDAYLRVDEDGDHVLTQHPCPFLGDDHYCSIYDVRPRDCERYPYTDEDVLLKQATLTIKNAEVCPAVTYIMERLLQTDIK